MSTNNGHRAKPLPSFSTYRPRAGHPDWPTLDREARDLADQLLPLLQRPRRGWRARRRVIRSYETAARNYAENRRRDRSGRWDLLPLYFIWTALRRCNFDCTYCDDHRGRKYPDLDSAGTLDTEQAIRLLRIMRTGTPSVYFAGGEPTLRKDLPRVARAARDLDYYPIIVNTNGSIIDRLLRKDEWATWLADTDVVIVSLDALDIDRLAKMWATRRPDDVIRFHEGLMQWLHGAVRSPSFPGLLREFRRTASPG